MDINIEKVCRVCLNHGVMMSVFKVNVSKKIMACASVQVWPNDGLPTQICNKCSAKLHISFQFKKLCEKSDMHLRQYLLKKEVVKDNQQTNEPPIQPEPVPAPIDNNIFIECVNIQPATNLQPSFIPMTNNEATHINYNIQNTTDCSNVSTIVQVQGYSGVFQMPIEQVQQIEVGNNHQEQQIIQEMSQMQPNIVIQQEDQVLTQNNPAVMNERIDITPIRIAVNDKEADVINKMGEDKSPDTQCKVCGKVLNSLTKLNRHMCTHSKNPQFKCNVCLKGFTHSGNLKIHMRVHNDERPFKCDICGQGCRQQQDLEKHIRTHTGERPHACHYCTKAFATRSNLIAHIRTHTGERPYVCCVCQKAFCQSNELTKHMRTHTGEKSHVCDVCQKGFNGSGSLKVHMRLHTGVKPYTCKVCEKSFTQSHTLKIHLKIHQTENDQSRYDVSMGECEGEYPTSDEIKLHQHLKHER